MPFMPTLNTSHRPKWKGERKPFETGRITARWDGYNTTDWRRFRDAFRSKHPLCCVDGCRQPTYYVDHVVPVVQYMEQGGSPFDESNCQPLCFKHGNVKTGKEGRAKQLNNKT